MNIRNNSSRCRSRNRVSNSRAAMLIAVSRKERGSNHCHSMIYSEARLFVVVARSDIHTTRLVLQVVVTAAMSIETVLSPKS